MSRDAFKHERSKNKMAKRARYIHVDGNINGLNGNDDLAVPGAHQGAALGEDGGDEGEQDQDETHRTGGAERFGSFGSACGRRNFAIRGWHE